MQENNPIPTPETTTPIVVEQPKQSNFPTVLLSILLIISISIAGFFAYQTQMLVKELQEIRETDTAEPTTEPTATESSEIDPTKDWEDLISRELNISIKYPSGWFVERNDKNGVRIQNYDPRSADGREYDPVLDKNKYAIHISPFNMLVGSVTSIKELQYKLRDLEKECVYMGDFSGSTILSNESTGKIGVYDYYRRTKRCSTQPEYRAVESAFILNGKGMTISIGPSLDVMSQPKVFDQVLSTFKFIN